MPQDNIKVYTDVTLFREFHTSDNKVWGRNYEVEINYTTKKARVKINSLFPALQSTTGYTRWNNLDKFGFSNNITYEKHFYGLTVNGNKVFFYITEKKSNIVELLTLVKTILENSSFKDFNTGICQVVETLCLNNKITSKERAEIINFLNHCKPTDTNKFKEFTENEYWIIGDEIIRGYWWDEMSKSPETKQIRIDYLTKLISNIK